MDRDNVRSLGRSGISKQRRQKVSKMFPPVCIYAHPEHLQSTYNPSPSPQAGLFSPVLSCYQTHSGIALCPLRHTSFTHSLTLSFPPCRYIEHSVRTLSRKCLPSTTQSQEQNMTLFSLAVAVEAQPVRYVSPVSTHVLGTYYVIVTRSVAPRFMAQRPPS